jgi:hypothetical protein
MDSSDKQTESHIEMNTQNKNRHDAIVSVNRPVPRRGITFGGAILAPPAR